MVSITHIGRENGAAIINIRGSVGSVRQLEPKAINVKVMLDTFHMNIEEQSIGNAIRTAGDLLGHFHTGECNRMVTGQGRTSWRKIYDALQDVKYDGACLKHHPIFSAWMIKNTRGNGSVKNVFDNVMETSDLCHFSDVFDRDFVADRRIC